MRSTVSFCAHKDSTKFIAPRSGESWRTRFSFTFTKGSYPRSKQGDNIWQNVDNPTSPLDSTCPQDPSSPLQSPFSALLPTIGVFPLQLATHEVSPAGIFWTQTVPTVPQKTLHDSLHDHSWPCLLVLMDLRNVLSSSRRKSSHYAGLQINSQWIRTVRTAAFFTVSNPICYIGKNKSDLFINGPPRKKKNKALCYALETPFGVVFCSDLFPFGSWSWFLGYIISTRSLARPPITGMFIQTLSRTSSWIWKTSSHGRIKTQTC